MNLENEEFQFALEMIIASRNENGATLADIRDDYNQFFGRTFQSMFGNCWTVRLRNLMLNAMDTIFTRQLPTGCTLFFLKMNNLREKLQAASKNENMQAILNNLKIDPDNIEPYRGHYDKVQGSFDSSLNSAFNSNSNGSTGSNGSSGSKGSNGSKVSNGRPAAPKSADFYSHTLIADNFFLELSNIDLQLQKSNKNQVERIGLCISGQNMKSAYRTVSYSPYKFLTNYVILNIGTFDLLNGRSGEQMMTDIVRLLNALQKKNLQAILTTLAPLPDHLNGEIEDRRQSFNKFIREQFDFIDIEKCFLTNEKRVLLECYQPTPKAVGGSKHKITLWNRVGRQRVLQCMKREIPRICPIF